MAESAAGAALRHRGTTHEDMQRSAGERLRSGDNDAEPDGGSEIPPEIQEALVLDHQARHYRRWLDEPVPALDDRTPRAAAKDADLRPRLVELLHDLGRMYQRSLKLGHPAFDPSWMWDALGLGKEPPSHPPPLAHERIGQLVPGSGEVCRAVAEALRRHPGFDDRSTVLGEEVVHTNLELQRLLRERQAAPVGRLPEGSQGLDSYLLPMLNFELHRRESFWVDESLAYMLARTDLDVRGDELRVPFPSFAMVFSVLRPEEVSPHAVVADLALDGRPTDRAPHRHHPQVHRLWSTTDGGCAVDSRRGVGRRRQIGDRRRVGGNGQVGRRQRIRLGRAGVRGSARADGARAAQRRPQEQAGSEHGPSHAHGR
jgi:hypothetical protein